MITVVKLFIFGAIILNIGISPSCAFDLEPKKTNSGLRLINETLLDGASSSENNRHIPYPSHFNMSSSTTYFKVPSLKLSELLSVTESGYATSSTFKQMSTETGFLETFINNLRNISASLLKTIRPSVNKGRRVEFLEGDQRHQGFTSEAARSTTEEPAEVDLLLMNKLKEIDAMNEERSAHKNSALQYSPTTNSMFFNWIYFWFVLNWCPTAIEIMCQL